MILPEKNTLWDHPNGHVYKVVGYTNLKTTKPDQYPITIVYESLDDCENWWSRPLSKWHDSMTPHKK